MPELFDQINAGVVIDLLKGIGFHASFQSSTDHIIQVTSLVGDRYWLFTKRRSQWIGIEYKDGKLEGTIPTDIPNDDHRTVALGIVKALARRMAKGPAQLQPWLDRGHVLDEERGISVATPS